MSEETKAQTETKEQGTDNSSSSSPAPSPASVPKGDDSKTCAILSYLLVGIIWYFVDEDLKKSEFARFHVKQAANLLIIGIALSSVMLATFILVFLVPLVNLATAVLAIVGIINAANGDKKQLPIIGSYAERYLKF